MRLDRLGLRVWSLGSSGLGLRALMCFDVGGLNTLERCSTLPFKSIHRDLRTMKGCGPLLRDHNFCSSEGPIVRGDGRKL